MLSGRVECTIKAERPIKNESQEAATLRPPKILRGGSRVYYREYRVALSLAKRANCGSSV